MWVRVLVQEFKIPQVAVFFGMAKKKKKNSLLLQRVGSSPQGKAGQLWLLGGGFLSPLMSPNELASFRV